MGPHPKLGEEHQLQGSLPGVPILVGELIAPSQEELGPHLELKLTGLEDPRGIPELSPQRQGGMEAGWRHRPGPSRLPTGWAQQRCPRGQLCGGGRSRATGGSGAQLATTQGLRAHRKGCPPEVPGTRHHSSHVPLLVKGHTLVAAPPSWSP